MELVKYFNNNKRIEKIAQATYLVSHHLKDNEPLKWELRKESIALLACSRSIGQQDGSGDLPTDLAIDALCSCARDLISFLSLSHLSGLISKNNAQLIIHEIDSILKSLEKDNAEYSGKAGFVLSEEFFKQIDKGQNPDLLSNKVPISHDKKLKDDKNRGNNIKDKKDNRIARIINLLKSQSHLTIKDFVRVISDCSEKTIQRELIDLVEKGVVKKEGERRWSKYSLK